MISRKKAIEIKLSLNNDIKIRILNDTRYSKSATAKIHKVVETATKEEEIDNHKRGFLKYAGVTGLGIAAYLAFPKKAEALIMGSTPTSNIIGVKNAANIRIDPATETTVSGIKTKTDNLTFDGGNNLYVQAATGFTSQLENVAGTVINPATENTLASMKAKTDLLTFDGSNNLLTATTGAASAVGIKDTTNTQVNPATEDSNVYLRRIIKLMESQATVDGANRQRVTLDAMTGGLTLAAVTTVSTVSNITGGNITTLSGYDQRQYIDGARNAYANSIRQNLTFS